MCKIIFIDEITKELIEEYRKEIEQINKEYSKKSDKEIIRQLLISHLDMKPIK